jgi:uncharacterized membrane protein
MPRALFFFRWGAMLTFVLGLALLYLNYSPNNWAGMGTSRGYWIMMGAGFGTIMWFNVWFIIWPSQRKIINGVKTGTPAPAEIVTRAANASKVNVYLSVPMVFAMLAASNKTSGDYTPFNLYWVGAVLVIGFFAAMGAYKRAAKVSTEV